MLSAKLSDEAKLQRGIALEGIAEAATKLAEAGGDDIEVQTFIHGAKRELARKLPDPQKMGEAAMASKQYQLEKQRKQNQDQ